MKINVNIRFFILGVLFALNVAFKSIILGVFSIFPLMIIAFWALNGLLKSFPDFLEKNIIDNNQNIIFVFLKKIINIFIKFFLAMLSLSLPFLIYLYFKP